jgi:hypothetical protein
MNLYEAQWLLPYRRFAAVLTDGVARLGADMDRYSFVVSDLHRLLVAGLPAHRETFCTSSDRVMQEAVDFVPACVCSLMEACDIFSSMSRK